MKWLDRNTVVTPHLILCGTSAQFDKIIKQLGVKNPDLWLKDGFAGCTHTYTRNNKITCVVCLDFDAAKLEDGHTVCGILIHESIHVWQELCVSIGEHAPSREFEAYTVQMISQRLIKDYFERERGYKPS